MTGSRPVGLARARTGGASRIEELSDVNHVAIAGRYARALFDVSLREGDPRAVERQLAVLVDVLEKHPVLGKALGSPIVPLERKQATVAALADRLAVASELRKLLALLVERDAFPLLPDLLARYRQRLMDHLGVVQAEVTTAVPLTEQRLEALGARLAAATGKDVTVVARVDPAIIGGVVARLGSTVYDGSVTRQLERIRERIVEGAGG